MSHFTVLVIGQDPERRLQPFHEFECTGEVDQFVQSIDQLAEARNEYETKSRERYKSQDGKLHDPYGDEFYREPTEEEKAKIGTGGSGITGSISYWSKDWSDGNGYRPKVHHLPDGFEKVDAPLRELMTFREYVEQEYERPLLEAGEEPDLHGEHKWGWYALSDTGEVRELIRRTNPNKKWDWYSLGGRWAGFFKMKSGVSGIKGRPGLMTPPAEDGESDSAFKGDIDFDGMRTEAEEAAAAKYDAVRQIIEPHLPFTPWAEIRSKYIGETKELEGGIEAARAEYHAQPARKALNESEEHEWSAVEDFLIDRDTYVRREGIKSCMTFAVLKDGQWYERGSMGWWGCVSNEKEDGTWIEEFGKLVAELPDDTLLSVYDCHI